jgi:hypothetical protein
MANGNDSGNGSSSSSICTGRLFPIFFVSFPLAAFLLALLCSAYMPAGSIAPSRNASRTCPRSCTTRPRRRTRRIWPSTATGRRRLHHIHHEEPASQTTRLLANSNDLRGLAAAVASKHNHAACVSLVRRKTARYPANLLSPRHLNTIPSSCSNMHAFPKAVMFSLGGCECPACPSPHSTMTLAHHLAADSSFQHRL